jgi:Tfp pilus assembly ATPase PilU
MQLLDDHLWELYDKELIDLEDLLDKARNPGEMIKMAEEKAGGSLGASSKKLEDEYGPIIKTST